MAWLAQFTQHYAQQVMFWFAKVSPEMAILALVMSVAKGKRLRLLTRFHVAFNALLFNAGPEVSQAYLQRYFCWHG
jgi:hypothetical protein